MTLPFAVRVVPTPRAKGTRATVLVPAAAAGSPLRVIPTTAAAVTGRREAFPVTFVLVHIGGKTSARVPVQINVS
jgi:hypothetical protein